MVVVVLLPKGGGAAGLGQRREQGGVETLVPEAAVEALHEGVLHRLSGRDVVPFDAGLLAPPQDGYRGQLRAVVGDDRGRPAAVAGSGAMAAGRPRRRMMASSSRTRRRPDNEVSATSARHSRV